MPRLASALQAVPLALLGSTSERVSRLVEWDAAITQPIATSRRIGFVQLHGGSGASATAASVASVFAARRSGLVLAVDATAGPAGLLWHSGLEQAPTAPSERRRRPRSAQDAAHGLPRTAAGLAALGLRTAVPGALPGASTWFEELSGISRFFDVVCTDWGVRPWNADLAEVAASSHVVCLVARADRRSAEEALALVPALRAHPESPRVVVALVDVGDTAGRAAAVVEAQDPEHVVPVPYDRARAQASPVTSDRLATRTRMAYRRLAATLLHAARPAAGRRHPAARTSTARTSAAPTGGAAL
ncbi:MinD/ParA family ATP-binding protein [Compostimonas suwonensis]|uniref:MinD-like ATPase involved in chromosome partitioning or flagellar assembly n=1 Tax=Compostimonas suwonensis TaxID=1048394 RepID=A0A2M9C595_9MICO|nr:hypothetical protein [Compostimonas suwonensis]PJJ65700.1 MinD-like ATPase involved in chromosome partitioning or flagellar assembly [Compostimonas suwonensis]